MNVYILNVVVFIVIVLFVVVLNKLEKKETSKKVPLKFTERDSVELKAITETKFNDEKLCLHSNQLPEDASFGRNNTLVSSTSDIVIKKIPNKTEKTVGVNKNVLGIDITFTQVLEEIKQDNAYFLDTETTGLTDQDKIIEISIFNIEQDLIYHSIINPNISCSEKSRSIHGISENEILTGKLIPDAQSQINKLLKGKTIITFNANFDCRMLNQTFDTHISQKFCVMKWSEDVLDYERYPRLSSVCERLGIIQDNAHRSKGDTISTISVFNKLSSLLIHNKQLLKDFAEIDLNKLKKMQHGDYLYLRPNSNIFAFDDLIDKYGNTIIGIRSKTLRRMLKKPATRISVNKRKNSTKLKITYIKNEDLHKSMFSNERQELLRSKFKINDLAVNKYLSLNGKVSAEDITWYVDMSSKEYYLPSIFIQPKEFDDLNEVVFYENYNRNNKAFIISNPKRSIKKLMMLSFLGYSSIINVKISQNQKIELSAIHLLDYDGISVLSDWSVDGIKDWDGYY